MWLFEIARVDLELGMDMGCLVGLGVVFCEVFEEGGVWWW